VDFLYFWSNKIYVCPNDIVSSLFPPRWCLSSNWCRHTMSRLLPIELRWTHYLHFIFRQCFIPSHSLLSQNRSIEFTPSQSSSSDRSTHTLHCYKKIISIMTTLSAHHSTALSFCLLSSQSTMPSELYPPPSFLFTVVPCLSSFHTMTLVLIN
jgi:hypothetical protein